MYIAYSAQLDMSAFRTAILSSSIRCSAKWLASSVDELAKMYDSEILMILDNDIPIKTVRCTRHSSDPWFDGDCRAAKRIVRQLERAVCRVRRNDPDDSAGAVAAATAAWTLRRRAYRELLRQKRESFWMSKVDSERSSPKQLWRSIDALLGRGHSPILPPVSVDVLHKFFNDKVDGIRASTSGEIAPSFTEASSCSMCVFQELTVEDIFIAVRALPDKQCVSDPIPTRMLKENVDIIAPFLVELFNQSLALGVVPTLFKSAYITPLLKKIGLDPTEAKSYMTI
jgi:hypothetical protein